MVKGKPVPPVKLEPRPEYKFMSKADVVAAENKRKEREAMIKAYGKKLETGEATVEAVETPVEQPKKMGRPKKIE